MTAAVEASGLGKHLPLPRHGSGRAHPSRRRGFQQAAVQFEPAFGGPAHGPGVGFDAEASSEGADGGLQIAEQAPGSQVEARTYGLGESSGVDAQVACHRVADRIAPVAAAVGDEGVVEVENDGWSQCAGVHEVPVSRQAQ
jgi:hypothetical protein